MQLPGFFKLFSKTQKPVKKYYLTLLFEHDYVAGSSWNMGNGVKPELAYAVSRRVRVDSWDERLTAADDVITAIENKIGTDDLNDVILGLPSAYLTPDGDINHEIRVKLKQITRELDLIPIGFVSLNQAIIYKIKHDEGVPPSAVLISVTTGGLWVFLYKVGNLIGFKSIPSDNNIPANLEAALKDLGGKETLPAKIVLFGSDSDKLSSIKESLVGYPWTSKLNFLHLPKISIMPPDYPITSVSMAGANELSKKFPDLKEEEDDSGDEEDGEETLADVRKRETPISVPSEEDIPESESQPNEDNPEPDSDEKPDTTQKQSETDSRPKPDADQHDVDQTNSDLKINPQFSGPETTIEDAMKHTDSGADMETESNVRVVNPEEFGFHQNTDVLEKPVKKVAPEKPIEKDIEQTETHTGSGRKIPPVGNASSAIAGLTDIGSKFHLPKFKLNFSLPSQRNSLVPVFILVGLLVVVFGVGWLLLTVLPKAQIDISLQSKPITETSDITIDPDVTGVDAENLIIPGKKSEKTFTGEKTVKATGVKKVGTPAKGTVVIYNKTLSPKTFKKGTVISTGGVKFNLDNDVQIASASESVGSITFGKGDAPVTASDIGASGNVSSGSEFTFADTDSSVASARNEQDFSGGTSKDITVVSRADVDALVKAVTADLSSQAQSDFGASGSSTVKLIDSTIKTSVSQKKFDQEVDQEASQLHGTVSVLVSGIGYDEGDVKNLMLDVIKSKIPSGYQLEPSKTQVNVSDITVKKSGVITAQASVSAVSQPEINQKDIIDSIAGKSVDDATKTIKSLPGVTDVKIIFQSAIVKNRLPKSGNIKISVNVQ